MKTEYSRQYQCPSVIPDGAATYEDIVEACRDQGAIYYEDGPEDECFVVTLRPNIGPELWTPRALKNSFKSAA